MRLSAEAKALLDANKVEELQALPIERLIHDTDLREYQRGCAKPLRAISFLDSVAPGLHDPISMESLSNPVVISSGFIFSEATVQDLLKKADPTCPTTRESLLRNGYGPADSKQSYVRLTKIDKAVDAFRLVRDMAREEARSKMVAVGGVGAAGGAGAAGTDASSVKTAVAAPALSAASTVEPQVLLHLKVSGSKIRVILASDSKAKEIDFSPMTTFFKMHFPKPESEVKTTPTLGGYALGNTGCCWDVQPAISARLEFWFEAHHLPTDKEVTDLMNELLRPLALPAAEIPDGAVFGSITSLGPREYKDAFDPILVGLEKAKECCTAFLSAVRALASRKGITLNDTVLYTTPPAEPARHSGVMFFGTKPVARAAGAPVSSVYSSVAPGAPAPSAHLVSSVAVGLLISR